LVNENGYLGFVVLRSLDVVVSQSCRYMTPGNKAVRENSLGVTKKTQYATPYRGDVSVKELL
jgi:hypothetical protein